MQAFYLTVTMKKELYARSTHQPIIQVISAENASKSSKDPSMFMCEYSVQKSLDTRNVSEMKVFALFARRNFQTVRQSNTCTNTRSSNSHQLVQQHPTTQQQAKSLRSLLTVSWQATKPTGTFGWIHCTTIARRRSNYQVQSSLVQVSIREEILIESTTTQSQLKCGKWLYSLTLRKEHPSYGTSMYLIPTQKPRTSFHTFQKIQIRKITRLTMSNT